MGKADWVTVWFIISPRWDSGNRRLPQPHTYHYSQMIGTVKPGSG
jgi:hypothetical protein